MDPLGQVAVELGHAAVLKMILAWRSSDATTSTCPLHPVGRQP